MDELIKQKEKAFDILIDRQVAIGDLLFYLRNKDVRPELSVREKYNATCASKEFYLTKEEFEIIEETLFNSGNIIWNKNE